MTSHNSRLEGEEHQIAANPPTAYHDAPPYPPPPPPAGVPAYAPPAISTPPPYNAGRPAAARIGMPWSTAIMTAFFPCVTFGQIAEILDEGETSSNYRRKLSNKYNLVEAPSEDWSVHLFCPCCTLCQEFRELQHRGIDPSLGWMGYLAQNHGAATTATTPPEKQFIAK